MKILVFISVCFFYTNSFTQTVADLRPTVTMKEYVDAQIEWSLKLSEVRDENIRDNVNKANLTMDKRLDGMNEFRDALKDSNATYITRSELIAYVVAAASLFWGYSKHQREKQEADRKGSVIRSGDNVEVKK